MKMEHKPSLSLLLLLLLLGLSQAHFPHIDDYDTDENQIDQDHIDDDTPDDYTPDDYTPDDYTPDDDNSDDYLIDQDQIDENQIDDDTTDEYTPDDYTTDEYTPDDYTPDDYTPEDDNTDDDLIDQDQIDEDQIDEDQIDEVQINDYDIEDDQADDESGPEPDIEISEQILTTNNASNEVLWEGDIMAPKTRNAMACFRRNCLWPKGRNGFVTVPFTMSRAFSRRDRQRIDTAMKTFHGRSCIRFVPRTNQRDYISVESRSGCFSNLGRTRGRQTLSLQRGGCIHHGIIQHEFNHALGFVHEQTRSDRDKYVRINFQYIRRGTEGNFRKQRTDNLGTPYDYSSVMHYGKTAFSTQRGRNTITPIPNPNVRIGQRQDMSRIDIQRLNKLYNC